MEFCAGAEDLPRLGKHSVQPTAVFEHAQPS